MGILAPRSHSEIDFLEKKSENVANSGRPPPPFSYLRDMEKKVEHHQILTFFDRNYFFENCSEMSTVTPKVLKNEFLGVFDAYFTTNTCVKIQLPNSPKSQHFVCSTMKCCDFGLVGD